MARRRKAEQRTLSPDPTYNSELVAKVINFTMRCGKKTTAERIVYGALGLIAEKLSDEPIEVLIQAIDNMKPRVEVKSRRVGGSTYQVPVEISRDRQLALALRWLLAASKARRGVPMGPAMAMELMDAFNGQGAVIRKRDDTHRMAQANKAFAHYAW
ncbi:MAG: 30S ribosomal protein S7 [Verrucomicrobia bacterium]|jgi:small subunit ribosomal protein S7|nr:30S ribosomal protein S7 [Verrucomicrobiota bacterium]MBT7065853.1 30S ribosomal protein S7 [Verrucomicrobiota bacterium]MBT7698797.1 30S ribosomal protein S7 [Verrucomicrobiota bacterium]